MSKLALVHIAHTGHVLGVVSRTAPYNTAPPPADLVGSGFPIRDPHLGDLLLTIGTNWLQGSLIDFRTDVLMDPFEFQKDNGGVKIVVKQLPPQAPPFTLQLGGSGLTLTGATAVPSDRKVFAQIERASTNERYPLTGTLAANQTSVLLGVGGLVGKYQVIVFLDGFFPLRKELLV